MTAELAVALPVLMALTIGLVWLLSLGVAQVRLVDAARETARALARGDAEGPSLERGAQVAPPGSTITVARGTAEVRVRVEASTTGPGGLFAHLPGPRLRAEAVAAIETAGVPVTP
ncbi:TadE family type IV pilus minor pilin [Nocardioides sp.]|uniref:TadE family type IV pilus minor pilin n=1 Tax=Nocardioides sp. TaxID=35761 RepID=UPI003564524A